MRTLTKFGSAGIFVFILMLAATQRSNAQYNDDGITFQTFYDQLSPYGTWVDDPNYGNVWVPDVDGDFRPYGSNGHWIVTSYGNTWVSDYDWGWAPFHYGRWRFDDYYGWEWIPDYEWGPAWVNWRHSNGYYGWAPLSPGISLDVSFGRGYRVPDNYWVFAPEAYITRPNIYNYYVARPRVVNILRASVVINNTYSNNGSRYVAGPRTNDIERVTHNRVNVYNINTVNRPGNVRITNNTVNIYRPVVRQAADARPARVVDAGAYRAANPDQRIAAGAGRNNHDNAAHLSNYVRNAAPDNNVIRVNTAPRNNDDRNYGRNGVPTTDRQPTQVSRPGQPTMNNRQTDQRNQGQQAGSQYQGQQQGNQPQQATPPTQDQQRQQRDQMRQRMQQAQQQQRQQGQQQQGNSQPPVNQQQANPQQPINQPDPARQQQLEQQRQQRRQQRQQQQGNPQPQINPQQDAQRQQQQQAQQQRQQQDAQQQQQRQQRDAQRQQQQDAQRQQQRQQQPPAQQQPPPAQQQQREQHQQDDRQRRSAPPAL